MKTIFIIILHVLFAAILSAQNFQITFSDHNAAQDLTDTVAWSEVAKGMDRYHAGWTFTTRDILSNKERQMILEHIGNKPIDIEFDPEEPYAKVEEYMRNIESNGGRIDIITYYMEPQYVADDEDRNRRGCATLVTPSEMEDIKAKIRKTGRDPDQYKYRGIIRMFALTDDVSRTWIKQYGNLTYEVGLPLKTPEQFNDIVNAINWCYANDVNIFMMMVPIYKAENSPHGFIKPNPDFIGEYRNMIKRLSEEVNTKDYRLNFVVAGYNYKYKKVPILPEGSPHTYPNTISGVARWLINYRKNN